MEPAAQLIMNPARRHFAQGEQRHPQRRLARVRARRRTLIDIKEKIQRHRAGKFRRAAEPAISRVVAARDLYISRIDQFRVYLSGRSRRRGGMGQRGHDLVAALTDLGAIVCPGVGDSMQHLEETRLPIAIHGREIGAADKRLQPRRQENIERPAAAAGRRLHESHVNAIDIRTLFAVDLDADKTRVQEGRDFFVLERLALHHVAPVAGRIADREEDRLFLAARFVEGLFAPRIPVDGIMRVLEQVGRFFVDEPIGVLLHMGGRNSSGRRCRSHPAPYRQSGATEKRKLALVLGSGAEQASRCAQ